MARTWCELLNQFKKIPINLCRGRHHALTECRKSEGAPTLIEHQGTPKDDYTGHRGRMLRVVRKDLIKKYKWKGHNIQMRLIPQLISSVLRPC